MPAEVSAAKLLSTIKSRAKGAWKRSRTVEPQAKGSTLPPGITGGVAQFKDWKLGMSKTNDPFFTLTGIVHEPTSYAGARCSKSYFIKESPTKTVEDQLNDLSNDMQLLGCQTADTNEDDIPRLLDELKESQPFYRFNTWMGKATPKYPNPQTQVFIQGIAKDYVPGETVVEVEDLPPDEPVADVPDEPTTDEVAEGEEVADEPVADEGEEYTPQVGDVFLYKASPKVAQAEAEVTAVDVKAQTVTLKQGNRIIRNVAWAKLAGE